MESDLGDLEAVQPGAQQENYPVCVCCGIRIDENNTAQRQGKFDACIIIIIKYNLQNFIPFANLVFGSVVTKSGSYVHPGVLHVP